MEGSVIDIPAWLVSGVVAAVLLAALGQGAAALVFGDAGPAPTTGWRETWRRWMWAHPIIFGGLLGGLFELRAPEALGDGAAARVVWYAAAGAVAYPVYRWVRRQLERPEGTP